MFGAALRINTIACFLQTQRGVDSFRQAVSDWRPLLSGFTVCAVQRAATSLTRRGRRSPSHAQCFDWARDAARREPVWPGPARPRLPLPSATAGHEAAKADRQEALPSKATTATLRGGCARHAAPGADDAPRGGQRGRPLSPLCKRSTKSRVDHHLGSSLAEQTRRGDSGTSALHRGSGGRWSPRRVAAAAAAGSRPALGKQALCLLLDAAPRPSPRDAKSVYFVGHVFFLLATEG
ncbi:Protein of unknown function [Gryllus bimaculatus]|nr:Protein of unknown function [Gryllus bimaculatus]